MTKQSTKDFFKEYRANNTNPTMIHSMAQGLCNTKMVINIAVDGVKAEDTDAVDTYVIVTVAITMDAGQKA